MKKVLFIILFIFVTCFYSHFLSAQDQLEFIRNQTLTTGFHYKSWSFTDVEGLDSFSEMVFPVMYAYPYSEKLSFDLVTFPFMSKIKPTTGGDKRFSNISDSYLRASYVLGDNQALFTLGIGVPSGKTDLSNDELLIAGVAANRPLNNPVTNFGAGLNVNFGAALAEKLGSWVVGAGIGYSHRGKYDIGEQNISPGNEFNITIGADRDFDVAAGQAKVIADIVYTNYGKDKLAGNPFFEAGDKILIRGQLLMPISVFNPVVLTISQRFRMDNKSSNAALIDNGNELDLRATFIQPRNSTLKFKYIVSSRIYSNTVDETGGAAIWGLGAGIVTKLTPTISFNPTFIYSFGTIKANQDINVKGFEVSGTVGFNFK